MEVIPESNYETENVVFTDEELRQNESSDRVYEIPEINKHEFQKWLLLSLVGIFYIVLTFLGVTEINCFIPIIVFELYKIISNIKNINDSLREIRIQEILEYSGNTLAIIVAIICDYKKSKISFSLIPYFAGLISSIYAKSNIINSCQMYSEIIYFIFRVTGSLALTGAIINHDFPSALDIYTKCIPLWIGILLLIIVIFFQILYTLNHNSSPSSTLKPKLGGLYLILSLVLFTISMSLFLILVLYPQQNSKFLLLLPLFFFILFSLSLALFYKQILISTFLYFQPAHSSQTSYRTSSLSTIQNSIISAYSTRIFLNKKSSSVFIQSSQAKPSRERHSSVYCILTQEPGLHKRSPTDQMNQETFEFKIEVEQCLLCADKYANAVIMKCGHGGVCFDCAFKMQQESGNCFICRAKIYRILKLLPRIDGEHEVIEQLQVV